MIPSGHQFGNRFLPIPYRPIRFVAKGAIGEVWKAAGPGDLDVAVKIVDLYGREGIKEFEGLQRIKNIRHANLVPIFGYWLIEGGQIVEHLSSGLPGAPSGPHPAGPSSFDARDSQAAASGPVTLAIAMGWGEKSLFSRLEESGTEGIPWEELLGYMDDAAKGIDYLNLGAPERGKRPGDPIIHGDIKPQNILIVGDSAQVCDFGLARAVEAARKTTTGMGTVAYAAPELLRGKPHRTSDQYCLAISYVELRTGRLPFEESLTPSEVVLRHEMGELDFSRLPAGEREVIRQATCPDPDQRWPLCRHMIQALRRACEAEAAAVVGPPAQREPASAREPSRGPAEDMGLKSGTLVVEPPAGDELTRTPTLRQVAETVPSRPKPSEPAISPRPRRGRRLAAVLLLLVAAGGGVMAYPPARQRVMALLKPEPPKAVDATGEAEKDITPPADPVKEMRALIKARDFAGATRRLDPERLSKKDYDGLLKELDEAWSARIVELNNELKHGEAIRVFEEAAWKCVLREEDRATQLAQLVTLWSRRVEELGKGGQFKEALDELDAVPDRSEAAREKAKLRQELRGQWQMQFAALLKNGLAQGDFQPPRDRLASAPGPIVDPELLKSSYAELVSAEVGYFVGKKEFEKGAEAIANVLETREHGRLEIGAKQKAALQEEVRTPWIEQLERDSAARPDSQVVLSACDKIQKHFPQSPEAALFRARALVHQKKYANAAEALNKSSPVPQPLAPLHSVLRFIAEYYPQQSSIIHIDPGKQPEKLSAWKNRAGDSLRLADADLKFDMKRWELDVLKAIKAELDNIRPPGPTATQLCEQVAERVSAGDFAKARELLKSAKTLAPKEAEFWGSVVELRDPAADPKKVLDAINGAEKLLKSDAGLSLADTQILCDALGQIHLKQNPDEKTLTEQLDRAVTLVADARKQRANANLAIPLGKLWERRIAIGVRREVPGKADFDRFESHWKLWQGVPPDKRPRVDEELVDLWERECLLACEKAAEAVQRLDPKFAKAEWAPYGHYVWAWTLSHAPKWHQVLEQLDQAFPASGEVPVVLKVRERLANALKLIVRASAQLRSEPGSAGLLRNPFPAPTDVDKLCRLLGIARAKVSEDPTLLDQAEQARLKIGLALAAWYKPGRLPGDLKLAASLTEELVKLEEKQLGPNGCDAAPVLYVYLRSHLPLPPQPPADTEVMEIIGAGGRLCQRLKDLSLTEEDAKTLGAEVLEPIRGLADKMKGKASKDQWLRLEGFYGAAADLVWNQTSLQWSDHLDGPALVNHLLDGAIYCAEQRKQKGAPLAELAGYYSRRGQLQLAQQDCNLDQVIRDADKAIENDGKLHDARGLRARALLKRSRVRAGTGERVADLTQSIEAGEKAAELCPQTEPARAVYSLNLSCAYLERANFDLRNREKDLKDAARWAAAAGEGPGIPGYPDYVYFAMGNAYEDLAHFVGGRDRAKYYGDAVKAFQKAAEKRPLPADAYCSIGRCYYKAVVESRLNDAELKAAFNKDNVAQVLEECKKSLLQAIFRDRNLVEAHWYLGLVHEYQSDYEGADQCFKEAVSRAKKTGLTGNLAMYVEKWATLPLKDKRLDRQQQLKEVQSRLEQHPGGPDAGRKLAQRAALTLATEEAAEYVQKAKWKEAEAAYTNAIAAYESASPARPGATDPSLVPLLLGRAHCNIRLAREAVQRSAGEAVIQDLYENILRDARRVADTAESDMDKSLAHNYAAVAHHGRYLIGRTQADWNNFVDQSEKSIQLVPAAKDQVSRYTDLANSTIELLAASAGKPDKTTLALVSKAIQWLESAIRLSKQEKLDFAAQQRTLVSQLELGIALATQAGNQKQADEWQKKLDTLTPAQPPSKQ